MMLWLALSLAVLAAGFVAAIHFGFRAPTVVETQEPPDFGMAFRQVAVPTAHGKSLFGWWLVPDDPDAPNVVLLHGWGANAGIMLPLAAPLYRAGFNVLLVDARGHGRSPSDGHSAMPKFAGDAGAAADWLRGHSQGRVALMGHSVGAAAVLLEAARRDDIAAVISVASFAHPEVLMQRWLAKLHIPRPLARMALRYIEWVIGHRFADIAPVHTIRKITAPVLLVHGDEDRAVPVSDFNEIAANCNPQKDETLLVVGAHHGSIDKIEAHADVLVRFLQRAFGTG